MMAGLDTPASQVFAFALGCALIHAARAHSEVVTHLLITVAIVIVTLLLIGASGIHLSDDRGRFDDITVYAAIAGRP